MNENTLSQGEYSCMMLEKNVNVLKIGSQTAGDDGNITYFNPTQDLQGGFSTLGEYYPDTTQTQRIGIVPDVVVRPTIAGIRHGVDELLDSAISIACTVSTGISKVKNERHFSLYPNPGNNFVRLLGAENEVGLQINVSDLLGQELIRLSPGEANQDIDISFLASGIYFLNIYDSHQAFAGSLKFVKD